MSFPRYPSYKDSGVEWLGEVPGHWRVVPLKHLADFINGDAFKPTEWAESGTPIIRIQNLNGSEEFNYYNGEIERRYLVHDGDLLFGWSGNRGTSFGPFLWSRNEVCALNQHIFRVAPISIEKHSLFWILKAVTAHVEDQAHGIIGMVHVTKGDLGAINVPTPPIHEQTQIASFLDRETAKIDALVAEQRRLMDLLKEKRQAVISHAVTRGLNPDAPMKPSGIEWLGDVPAHWKVRKLNAIARLESGHTPSRQRPEYWIEDDCVIPWFTLADVGFLRNDRNIFIDGTSQKISQVGIENSSARLLPSGTVILSRTASVGFSGITKIDLAVSQDFAAWICSTDIHPLYLLSCLRAMKPEFQRLMMGSTHQTIYMPDIEAFRVPLPPSPEQLAIADFVHSETTKFDTLTAEAQRAIDLLQERRTALISAAVTGQIDVRGMTHSL